jgi:hypothetical protein
MDDLFSAMLAVAFSAVMLVAGQQYLSKKSDILAATAAPPRYVAVVVSPAYAR